MEKVYIFGHKNPDTDSVCSAIALSYLKNQLGMKTEPRRLGDLNPETEFALKSFGVESPEYLNDVKVKIKDVKYNKNYMINENKPIIEAYGLMNKYAYTGVPIVDDNNKFVGYVSLKEIAYDMIYNESIKIETPFENLLNTLDVSDYLQFDDVISGYAHAATFDDVTFIRDIPLDNESILIVGDRESIINYALTKKVKMIILIKNRKLNKEQLEIAKKNKINIISSSKSSFKIARLLCLANPIKSIKRNTRTVTFNATDFLSDFEEATSKLKHTNYPIVDNNGLCLGMLRTIDAHEVTRKKVILVDHNMFNQSADGLNESEILEIIDHHNIGDVSTSQPINFRNMTLGSCCSLLYYLYKENNVKITKQIAGILLSGMLSDTLVLKSPTTTDKDKLIAKELASIAKVDINKYGMELLESGISIEGLSATDIIYRDFKTYDIGEESMVIGQVFTTDFNTYKDVKDSIINELDAIQEHHGYKICALFVTNIITNDSNVLFATKCKDLIRTAYGLSSIEEGQLLKGVMSRKKQMVPNLMSVIDHD